MDMFSDRGSTPLASTKCPKDEHLLFQRQLCRNGMLLRVKEKRADKALFLACSLALALAKISIPYAQLGVRDTDKYIQGKRM